MRSVVAEIIMVVSITLGLGIAPAVSGAQGPAASSESRVPRSLDALYPPAAGEPVYLLRMLQLDQYFSGIVVDLMEDDLPGAQKNFADFKALYTEVRDLVPEWKSYYPIGPVEELGAAVGAGDRGRLMAAFGLVGESCHHCHLATMVPVQQLYHWGDFGSITVKDPLTREATAFTRFKRDLAANLTGIRVDLGQGQRENAQRQFEAFQARFASLRESCRSCHDQDRRSYVDAEVRGLIEDLGRTLRSPQASPEELATLLQGIGRQSCSRCHLVHVPAALGQAASQ